MRGCSSGTPTVADILEDKKWQRAAADRGLRIAVAPAASVMHSHEYTLPILLRRCQDEGFGWRAVGEVYPVGDLVHDTLSWRKFAVLLRGLWRGQVRTNAELLFPFIRPWLVFKGKPVEPPAHLTCGCRPSSAHTIAAR